MCFSIKKKTKQNNKKRTRNMLSAARSASLRKAHAQALIFFNVMGWSFAPLYFGKKRS